jgi:hypothetical protein
VAQLERFAKQHQVSVAQFRNGERKDDVAAEYPKRFKGEKASYLLAGRPEDWEDSPVADAFHGHGQPFLHLCSGPRLWPVLPVMSIST